VAGETIGIGRCPLKKLTPQRTAAVQQRRPVDPEKKRGNQSHGGEYGIPPSQILGHRQGAQKGGIRFVTQETLLRIRHHEQVFLPCGGEMLLQPGQHGQILSRRFQRSPGLADHNHQSLLWRKPVQHGRERRFIQIVGNPQPGAVISRPVLTGRKGLLQGARSQSRASDTKKQHMPEAAKELLMAPQLETQIPRIGHGQKRQTFSFPGQTGSCLGRPGVAGDSSRPG